MHQQIDIRESEKLIVDKKKAKRLYSLIFFKLIL